jgi:hypothetical protein
MKKSLPLAGWFVFAMLISLLFSACKKQESEKNSRQAFKAKTTTWYRVSPVATPTTFTIGEKLFFMFAHVPGGGEGSATHLGKVKTYFNQLAYTSILNTPVPVPEGSVTAAVVDVINYPVLGAPLPLIQPGDFSGLAAINNQLKIPQSIGGKLVSSFFYNEKGDAVFISNSSASVITPISSTRNEFTGKALIVGGRGKFVNAYGAVDFAGWFNPADPNDAEYSVDGWISY